MTNPTFDELRERLQEVDDISSAASLLHWDQATYMPPGGASARSRQLATLSKLGHETFVDPVIGDLLDRLRPFEEASDPASFEASLIRVARREYERAIKVPAGLVAEIAQHTAASYDAWTKARPANDFAALTPLLERTVHLSRQVAECFPGYEHIADPLIDRADSGMTATGVRSLFAQLRQELVPLVQAITAKPLADESCLLQAFPEPQQIDFGQRVIRQFGYDFDRGRQDKTHHPFMTKFSLGDVRITSRFKERDLGDGLFSTMHECGHALYEQGINRDFEGTLLADGVSAGVHESQSRLWENLVGRSRPFWTHFYPKLVAEFPDQLGSVPMEAFYRAINRVSRSLIRTDADEVTYNLHIIIRFDLELALLEGSLAARDLPEAWRARYRDDLGIEPPDDRDGCMQDVHWFAGLVGGAFQGYTIGNVLSAQFYEAAVTARPEIPSDLANGEFSSLLGWLREHLHRYGAQFTAPETVVLATGSPLTIQPYVRYLKAKFGDLYGV